MRATVLYTIPFLSPSHGEAYSAHPDTRYIPHSLGRPCTSSDGPRDPGATRHGRLDVACACSRRFSPALPPSDRRDPSLPATLPCSKLLIPSSPQRPIIALSSSQGEPVNPRHRQSRPLTDHDPKAVHPRKYPQNWHTNSQGVVNICSPVKTAFAPAMKHIACFVSSSVCRPAARRMMVVGSTIRAVAIVRTSVWYGTGCTTRNISPAHTSSNP